MIKKPEKQEFNIFSFLEPLETNIWMYTILSYVCVSIYNQRKSWLLSLFFLDFLHDFRRLKSFLLRKKIGIFPRRIPSYKRVLSVQFTVVYVWKFKFLQKIIQKI